MIDLEKLQLTVIDALEDIKGQNIEVFDAQPLTSMFDRVVLVSGTSNRQTRALAKNLHDKVKHAGGGVDGTEGEETGEWVLVDLGDIIVHIMQPAIREYYRLEEIWGAHPIDWEALRKKPAIKRKATARKPVVEKAEKQKSLAGKPAVKNTGDSKTKGRTTSSQKSTEKPPATNKSESKKSGAKKPSSKKPVATKTGAKKARAKRIDSKKSASPRAAVPREKPKK